MKHDLYECKGALGVVLNDDDDKILQGVCSTLRILGNAESAEVEEMQDACALLSQMIERVLDRTFSHLIQRNEPDFIKLLPPDDEWPEDMIQRLEAHEAYQEVE